MAHARHHHFIRVVHRGKSFDICICVCVCICTKIYVKIQIYTFVWACTLPSWTFSIFFFWKLPQVQSTRSALSRLWTWACMIKWYRDIHLFGSTVNQQCQNAATGTRRKLRGIARNTHDQGGLLLNHMQPRTCAFCSVGVWRMRKKGRSEASQIQAMGQRRKAGSHSERIRSERFKKFLRRDSGHRVGMLSQIELDTSLTTQTLLTCFFGDAQAKESISEQRRTAHTRTTRAQWLSTATKNTAKTGHILAPLRIFWSTTTAPLHSRACKHAQRNGAPRGGGTLWRALATSPRDSTASMAHQTSSGVKVRHARGGWCHARFPYMRIFCGLTLAKRQCEGALVHFFADSRVFLQTGCGKIGL